jgi:hypothetical protein
MDMHLCMQIISKCHRHQKYMLRLGNSELGLQEGWARIFSSEHVTQ